MARISISEAATTKILEDRKRRAELLVRPPETPRLLYYRRSYLQLHDGGREEYGPGLSLDFSWSDGQATDNEYVPIELDGGCRVWMGPGEFFRTGQHFIDYVDRRFTVISLKD